MFGLYAWVYEQVSQRTSERIKAAISTNAKSGEFQGSIPPYGYTLIDKKLILADDGTPEVVKSFFELYIGGKGVDSIARSLSKKGMRHQLRWPLRRMLDDTGKAPLSNSSLVTHTTLVIWYKEGKQPEA